MLSSNFLPGKAARFSAFYSPNSWVEWLKPPGARMVYIMCIGGGGSGAAGTAGSAGAYRSGGAGGGSSAYSTGLWPANQLPDRLYVYVGAGGAASATTTGNQGGLSYVTIAPDYGTGNNILIQNGAAAAGGGSTGTGGTAGAVWNPASGLQKLYLGALLTWNGGAVGGSAGNGAGTSINVVDFLTPGAGGGGCSLSTTSSGGSITAVDTFLGIPGGVNGSTASQNGASGLGRVPGLLTSFRQWPQFAGGAGGASNNSAPGGDGGSGSYGCGGGGGAGGTTGGIGGRGGDGLVMITVW